MNYLEILTVGNGSKKYPGDFTKKEIKIIKYNCRGKILHLFSGCSLIGHERIDYACKEATKNIDVFEYLENCNKKFNTVIIDAPYNEIFAKKYQKIGNTPRQFIIFADAKGTIRLFDMIRKIEPEIIILKSWHYYTMKSYYFKKGYLCYPGRGRKSTILLIFSKEKTNNIKRFL